MQLTTPNRLPAFFIFAGISLLFVISQALFFQGFNGTDDVQYSFLAAQMVQGKFSLFVLNDVFTGRALLVLLQAAVFTVGGISPVTANVLTYAVAIGTGYLTVFSLMKTTSPRLVLVASALFYFNPVLVDIAVGPSPDIVIMLVGVIILLLLRSFERSTIRSQFIATGFMAGLLGFSTLYIKESGLVFMPFLVAVMLLPLRKKRLWFLGAALAAFGLGVIASGFVYYHYTGNAFYRVQQRLVSNYVNPCFYTSFFNKPMFVRLTYGVWEEFFKRSFLSPLLATMAAIGWLTTRKEGRDPEYGPYMKYFIILLLIGLYFPFSVTVYQPLCFKTRHFLFILPLSVMVGSRWLEKSYDNPPLLWQRNAIAAVLLGISAYIINNGWYWNFARCLLAFLLLFPFFISKKMATATPLLLAAILWLCLPYNFIFHQATWYAGLKAVNKNLAGQRYFYFADHDNMMLWKLLNGFDTTIHTVNFDRQPQHIPNPYYEPLKFHPGWFIVNRQYSVRSKEYFNSIDSMQRVRFFDSTIRRVPITAYSFSTKGQFILLQQTMQLEKQRDCNCPEAAR